jgi:hypothetical protein
VSPTKNLYVRDDDAAIWDRAEVLARASRVSVSQIVSSALREFMAGPPDIDVHIVDPDRPDDDPPANSGRPTLTFPERQRGRLGWRLRLPDGESEFLAGDALNPPLAQARIRLRANESDDQAQPLGDIIVEVGDPWQTVGFRGRWLVQPDIQHTRSVEDKADRDAYWGVALTARGRIAVYVAHAQHGWPARLEDYDSLTAVGVNVPNDIRAMAARALGEEQIVWRDI